MKNFDLGRKGLLSMVALLIGTGLEKFGGGLTPEMTALLVSVVGLFTGSNVLAQKIAMKGSPVPAPQRHEEPAQQPPADLDAFTALEQYVQKLDQVCGQQFQNYNAQLAQIEKMLGQHTNSITGLTQILNKGASGGQQQKERTTTFNLAE